MKLENINYIKFQKQKINVKQMWSFHINKIIYFLINILLNHKYLNMKSYYKYFKFIKEIIDYLIKYHVLKS